MKKPRIIYVEDEPDDVELLRHALRKGEIDVELVAVASEPEFLRELVQRCPDLVLSDNKVPGFSAPDALKFARQHCPDVPFICVSGLLPEKTAQALREAGALCCLSKDNPIVVAGAVREVLAAGMET